MSNSKNSGQFGFAKSRSYYLENIGKSIAIYFGNNSRSGVIQKIEDEFLFLCPYVGHEYSSGKPVAVLRKDLASRIRLDSITGTDEITMADLEGYAASINSDYADKEAERKNKLE